MVFVSADSLLPNPSGATVALWMDGDGGSWPAGSVLGCTALVFCMAASDATGVFFHRWFWIAGSGEVFAQRDVGQCLLAIWFLAGCSESFDRFYFSDVSKWLKAKSPQRDF